MVLLGHLHGRRLVHHHVVVGESAALILDLTDNELNMLISSVGIALNLMVGERLRRAIAFLAEIGAELG